MTMRPWACAVMLSLVAVPICANAGFVSEVHGDDWQIVQWSDQTTSNASAQSFSQTAYDSHVEEPLLMGSTSIADATGSGDYGSGTANARGEAYFWGSNLLNAVTFSGTVNASAGYSSAASTATWQQLFYVNFGPSIALVTVQALGRHEVSVNMTGSAKNDWATFAQYVLWGPEGGEYFDYGTDSSVQGDQYSFAETVDLHSRFSTPGTVRFYADTRLSAATSTENNMLVSDIVGGDVEATASGRFDVVAFNIFPADGSDAYTYTFRDPMVSALPEPGACASILAGLGLLGFIGGRRGAPFA